MSHTEHDYYIAFSVFPGIGPVRFDRLLTRFGSALMTWNASVPDISRVIGESLAMSFETFRRQFDLNSYLMQLRKLQIHILLKGDPHYPAHLSRISDAPFVLYVRGKKGDTPIDLQKTLAVVGTRRMSQYGKQAAARLVADLVTGYGFTIVSGMAYGIDAVAHQSALDHGGSTLAVLGCGADVIAPASNAGLYRDIIGSGRGAVLSEMPLGHLPLRGLFPARNRIISGLSLGVLVVEGALDSGSLITARNALDQGREVFAVPGQITSRLSRGPALLLKNGAVLVETAEDIAREFGIGEIKQLTPGSVRNLESDQERAIAAILSSGSMHIDEVSRGTRLTTQVVAATLTLLEMRGIVKDLGGKVYCLL